MREETAQIDEAAGSEAEFLHVLGMRVRELRARRGMTRKIMACESGVSERHLAQLESGEGNVSALLLRRIASTLNVSLAELFATRSVETQNDSKTRIRQLLERLPENRLDETLRYLAQESGVDVASERAGERTRVALIGLRGAGKSTLGSRLSQELGIPFIELDHEIEKDTGMPLAEIFSLYGQAGYRRIEKRALERVLQEQQCAIISVGGGVVSERETYEHLLANCYTVWVKALPEEYMARVIAQGDFRAMADNDEAMEDLRRILDAREPFYRQANMQLDTSGENVATSFAKLKPAVKAVFS